MRERTLQQSEQREGILALTGCLAAFTTRVAQAKQLFKPSANLIVG
jgi:hypothetical protein